MEITEPMSNVTVPGEAEEPAPPVSGLNREDFDRRVETLMQMMKDDPDIRDRVLAETYVNIAQMEMGVRGAFELMQREGIAGMMKGMIGRRKKSD